MATRRPNDPIEPMDLENMGQNGVRSLWIQYNECRHTTAMNVDHLPGDLTMPSLGPRMVCTKCGTIAAPDSKNQAQKSQDNAGATAMI
jgi:hypothetical protein